MLLFLNVLTYRGKPPAKALSHIFDAQGGSVGRSSSNQFVLPDPAGFISRVHGIIAFRDGAYAYTDSSTGGTYLATRNMLLEQDTLVLRNGDILRVGEYEIAVAILPDPSAEAAFKESEPPPRPGSSSPTLAKPIGFRHRRHPHSGTPDLFGHFLEGVGLDCRDRVRDEDLPELMKSAGILFRALVEGTLALSRTRSETRQSAASQSTRDTNPLGSAATLNDALELMLLPPRPGFMDPAEAVRASFGDILIHQISMSAAIQAELIVALRRFDPSGIEKLFGDPGEEGKTRCWEAFRKAYPELVDDITENFFGEEFQRIYERQLRLLQSAKTR